MHNQRSIMKTFKLITSLFLVLLFCLPSKAQQTPVWTHYVYNPYLYNPARAGSGDMGSVNLIHRQQWVNMPDAPISSLLSFEMPIKDSNVGVGGMLYSDETHILNNIGGLASYAYHIPFNTAKTTRLSIGLSGGILNRRADFLSANVEDPTDIAILENDVNGVAFDAAAGINFGAKRFNLGVSVPQIIGNKVKLLDNAGDEVRFELVRHFLGTLSYKFGTKKIHVEPVAFVRYVPSLPIQYEGSLVLDWNETLFLGAGYRSSSVSALAAHAGVRIKKRFSISYAFETGFDETEQTAFGNTHEIMVGYHFGQKGPSMLEQRMSELESKVETVEKRILYNEKSDAEKFKTLEESDANQTKELETLGEKVESNSSNIESNTNEIKVIGEGNEDIEKRMNKAETEIEELKRKLAEIYEQPYKYKKLGSVYFEQGKHDLDADSKARLEALKQSLDSKGVDYTIYLAGNASKEGNSESNMILSVKRTVAAKEYLEALGINGERIVLLPYGEENPDQGNLQLTEEERKLSRRVDVFITNE